MYPLTVHPLLYVRNRNIPPDLGNETRLGRLKSLRADEIRIPLGAFFPDALLVFEINIDDAKALAIPQRPFKIVEQRPDKIAAQVHPLLDGTREGCQMRLDVIDAARVVDIIVLDHIS